jgi:hypothetical protein
MTVNLKASVGFVPVLTDTKFNPGATPNALDGIPVTWVWIQSNSGPPIVNMLYPLSLLNNNRIIL